MKDRSRDHVLTVEFFSKRLIALLLFGAVLGCVVYVPVRLRRLRFRVQHTNYMKMVLLGLHAYNETHGSLPPQATVDQNAVPTCSWRFRVRPFLDSGDMRPVDYGVPWNRVPNKRWSPNCRYSFVFGETGENTNILAIAGADTGFDSGQQRSIQDLPDDLILVIEVRDARTHWMEPGDIDVTELAETLDSGVRIAGEPKVGFLIGFADGVVWLLDEDTPIDELSKYFTITGASSHNRYEHLESYRIKYRTPGVDHSARRISRQR